MFLSLILSLSLSLSRSAPSPLPHLLPIYPKRSIPSVKSKFADWCTLFISMKIEVALLKAALTLPLSLNYSHDNQSWPVGLSRLAL